MLLPAICSPEKVGHAKEFLWGQPIGAQYGPLSGAVFDHRFTQIKDEPHIHVGSAGDGTAATPCTHTAGYED
jgi:hypothetical protein